MPFGARDLRAFFGTGVLVSFAGVSTYPDGVPIRGLFDRPVSMKLLDQGIGGVEAAMPELRLPFDVFRPMPQDGDTLIADGVTYTVAQPTTEDDGAILCYPLQVTE